MILTQKSELQKEFLHSIQHDPKEKEKDGYSLSTAFKPRRPIPTEHLNRWRLAYNMTKEEFYNEALDLCKKGYYPRGFYYDRFHDRFIVSRFWVEICNPKENEEDDKRTN